MIELSSINKVSLVYVSSCSNTGSIRDDPYWTSRENSLELIELSSINKVSLVYVSSCSNIGSVRGDPYWASRENSL
jgi:ribosomal protein L7Ae-like RNA K-turn-binding protein